MNSKKNLLMIVIMMFCLIGGVQAQSITKLTLNDCITMAMENNADLMKSELSLNSANVNHKQAWGDFMPDLDFYYNLGINDGRSIDPFTNDIINQKLTFSNARLSLDLTVFNGFKLMNNLKQQKLSLDAAEMEIEEAKQNLALEVTLLYIQILNNRDLLELSKSQKETTAGQLERLKKLYDLGEGNPADYTDMLGQHTNDQAGVVLAENALNLSVNELLKVLNLDLDTKISFENIGGLIGAQKYENSADEIYEMALQNLATFKSKELRAAAAKMGIKTARSNYYPEISLFGQVGSNYSSLAQIFSETGTATIETQDFVTIDNQQFPVLRNEKQIEGNSIEYIDQLDNNLSSVIGVSLSIKLFDGFLARNNVSLKKIEREESLIEIQNTQVIFKQSINQAFSNMESAFERYTLFIDQVKAYEESFRINEIRFLNGASNIVEYLTSKNNMDIARLNLNTTKYEYLLRIRILDYYKGL